MRAPRLIFVTGKGGTGKSTVAAALATALSRHRPTVVADLDQRRSVAHLLGADLDGAGVARVSDTLEVMSLTPRRELEKFIQSIVPLKAISRRMLESRTFGYVTAALPGLEPFLLLDRLRRMTGEAARDDRYIVVDGPASGTTIELLSVAAGVKGLAGRGTLLRLASDLENFVRDPNRFAVALVLKPEELALQETLDLRGQLGDKVGAACFAAILNAIPSPLFNAREAGLFADLDTAHARLAQRRLELVVAANRARSELKRNQLRKIELPMIFKPLLGKAEIFELSQQLEKALVAS